MRIIILLFLINIMQNAFAKVSNLIEPVNYFVNHEKELIILNKKLNLHKKTGLIGVSGIGKTQFARMYAHQNKDKYNVIWFFDCNTDLSEQFVQLANELNNSKYNKGNYVLSESIVNAKQSVIKFISSKNDWLFVFDNVKVNKNKEIKDILEWEHNGHVIISSQDKENILDFIQVQYLKDSDAKILVKNILEDKDNDSINFIVKEFKGDPVLITRSSMFLNANKHISKKEYDKVLLSSNNKLISHMKMVIKELTPSARRLLYKIAMINNQKFSKELIKTISNNETFVKDLQSITRFGLISLIQEQEDKQVFEMHDVIKKSVTDIVAVKELKGIIEDNIDLINKIMPKGKNSRQLLISDDNTLLSNLYQLLKNAELYNVDKYKIMELRKNLMSFYVGLGSEICIEMEKWFNKNKTNINFVFMNDHQKAVFSEYLVLIGVYECYLKACLSDGINSLLEANKVINNIEGYYELKFMIYSQLAQAYIFNGDQKNTEIFLKESEKIIPKISNNLDEILFWVVKAKLDLSRGKYPTALNFMNKALELAKDMPQDYYIFTGYTIKAEILNYMSKYKEAYDITKRIYDLEIGEIKDGDAGGYRIRVIVELAKAELGLNKKGQSLKHAREAIQIYKNDKLRDNSDLSLSNDIDLAAALVVEGEALSSLKEYEKALDSFSTAEAIFYNKYRDNIKNMDNISDLYLKAAIAGLNLKNKFWYEKFSSQLIEKFGVNHFRSKKILDISK